MKKALYIAAAASLSLFSFNSLAAQSIDEVLAAQPEEVKARYQYRHPKETLEFFGIKPGMTVVEALPGGGWYSKILLPVLGKDGKLIGADYPMGIWEKFGLSSEKIEAKKAWVTTWTEEANGWRGENDATISAFQIAAMPEEMAGTADAVLFFRAMHGLASHEKEEGFLSNALNDSMKALKPGGIVGVVQHEARADRPDEWANGSNGYLKKQYLIDQFKAAGFEYVGDSNINENPKDQANEGDFVWRLPPSYSGIKEGEDEKRAAVDAIGESNRMTLLFRKPAGE